MVYGDAGAAGVDGEKSGMHRWMRCIRCRNGLWHGAGIKKKNVLYFTRSLFTRSYFFASIYRPVAMQGVPASLSSSTRPAAQLSQLEDPAGAKVPVAHTPAHAVAPAASEKSPAPQSVHGVEASLSSSTRPATQAVQSDSPVAPPQSMTAWKPSRVTLPSESNCTSM